MPVLRAEAGGVKVDPGTYQAECISVVEDHIENPLYGDGHTLKLTFRLDTTNDKGEPIELTASASYKLSPKSKLWGWIEAFGFEVKIGEDFDTDQLVGMSCQALIGRDEKPDGSVWAKIDQLFPLGKAAASPPSLINPNGSTNWTVFWTGVTKAGLNKSHVLAHVGSEEAIEAMDGPTATMVLEELTRKANA